MSEIHFTDAKEWFYASPQICHRCGALVHWNYTEQHVEWHADMEATQK